MWPQCHHQCCVLKPGHERHLAAWSNVVELRHKNNCNYNYVQFLCSQFLRSCVCGLQQHLHCAYSYGFPTGSSYIESDCSLSPDMQCHPPISAEDTALSTVILLLGTSAIKHIMKSSLIESTQVTDVQIRNPYLFCCVSSSKGSSSKSTDGSRVAQFPANHISTYAVARFAICIPHASQLTHAYWLHPIPLSHWCTGDVLISHNDVPRITGKSNLSIDCSTRSRRERLSHLLSWFKKKLHFWQPIATVTVETSPTRPSCLPQE